MVFNSLTFIAFLAIVYATYWSLNRKWQNHLLLVASYVFYGWWDWRFLGLLMGSSALDWWLGRLIGDSTDQRRRKQFLLASLISNLGVLGFFKYFNFFADSLTDALGHFGIQPGFTTLHIVLPVGISFYTFQSLSYTIDVYRKKFEPQRDLLEFMTFVGFFPQLVAGPIERATNLLGQFAKERTFDVERAKDGIRQMLWGFCQKIIVADGVAEYVNSTYAIDSSANGGQLLLASYFFYFQIYADFAGYTNIAAGCSRLFGFQLMRNFNYPYFSRSISEFWQRWHISLSSWFRDYVFFPLGANRGTATRVIFNVVVTFTLSGVWHGANWTFVFWGFINGVLLVPGLLRRRDQGKKRWAPVPELREALPIIATFNIVILTLVFFRSGSLTQVGHVYASIFTDFDWRSLLFDAPQAKLICLGMVTLEWIQRRRLHPFDIAHLPQPARWLTYNTAALTILAVGTFTYQPFIYFQF